MKIMVLFLFISFSKLDFDVIDINKLVNNLLYVYHKVNFVL